MTSDISSLAASLGISPNHLSFYGRDKAKVSLEALKTKPQRGKLILVSAITPTPAGEGKTTVSIGLSQGLKKIGQSVALALRQPSMGPVFGRKGGATGGGQSTVQPAQSINLHFTGDFHAITSANNLLSAVIDNQLFNGEARLKPENVLWKRVMDMNDRALRQMRTSAGKPTERATGFDITAASEVMAILCLSESLAECKASKACPPSCMAARLQTSLTAATRFWPRAWPSRTLISPSRRLDSPSISAGRNSCTSSAAKAVWHLRPSSSWRRFVHSKCMAEPLWTSSRRRTPPR